MALARQLKRTAVYVFGDVKSAYYTAIRELSMELPTEPEDRAIILESAEIPFVLLPALQRLLDEPTA
eukprot:4694670-Lingulodinium_polyedra.AAC.1